MASFLEWLLESDMDHMAALRDTGFWGRAGAGAIVVAADTGRILLPHRSMSVEQPGTWGVWGGAIDSGEDPIAAARREVEEEAGADDVVEMIPLYVFRKGDFRYHNFMAVVPGEFKPRLNWETQGYRWVDFGDWPRPMHFGLEALLKNSGEEIGRRISYFPRVDREGGGSMVRSSSFSEWVGRRLALEARGGAQPVQMPKVKSGRIEVGKVKERIPGGRRDTSMDSRPKRLRTRGDRRRDAIRDQDY